MAIDRSSSMGRRQNIVSLEKEIEKNGGKVIKVTCGRHYKVTAKFPEGEITFAASTSPRNVYCTAIQNKQLVRRELRKLREKSSGS